MKHRASPTMSAAAVVLLATAIALLSGFSVSATAQSRPVGSPGRRTIVTPSSGFEFPEHVGVRAHTNYKIVVPSNQPFGSGYPFRVQAAPHVVGPPVLGLAYETPGSIACVYKLVPTASGCNPNTFKTNPNGGSKAIAIVDAYDDPTAASDLVTFSTQFGLPAASFSVVFANGSRPSVDSTGGWELEESLDIEWAHAMAPGATIYLVEAASANFSDLLHAVDVASNLVATAGGGEVSMSWGGAEFSGETSYDNHFTTTGVVYFASSGDSPGVSWPSASPMVVSAGGTTTRRNPLTANFLSEVAWTEAGGGLSSFYARPAYQDGISTIVGSSRGLPDISADANPDTGVWVFYGGQLGGGPGWYIVGGTSVASPTLAGIINLAGHFASSTTAELTSIYANSPPGVLGDFRDITYGFCGPYAGSLAKGGWDFCSGVGSPIGLAGK